MINFALTMEEKIMAMAMVRTLGFSKAVAIMSKHKRHPIVNVRAVMDKIESTHYLISDGYIVKEDNGTVQYVQFNQSYQPIIITLDYFEKCKEARQNDLMEALDFLRCGHLVRPNKPAPIPRRIPKYE